MSLLSNLNQQTNNYSMGQDYTIKTENSSCQDELFRPKKMQIMRSQQPRRQDESPMSITNQMSPYFGKDPVISFRVMEKRLMKEQNVARSINVISSIKTGKRVFEKRGVYVVRATKNIQKLFIQTLRQASNNLRFSDLTSRVLNIVKHVVDYNLSDKTDNNQFLAMIPLLDSRNMISLTLELIIAFVLFFALFWYPFMISFDGLSKPVNQDIESIILAINSADIIMKFNRSTILQGRVIKNRLTILQLYIKSTFLFDVLGVFFLIYTHQTQSKGMQITFILFFIVCRVQRIFQIANDLIDYLNLNTLSRDIISLINMLITVVFIMHLIGCIWHLVAIDSNDQMTWLRYYGFQETSIGHQYAVSFYWAAMTMTTVGYGDITPKNTLEYIFANLTMLVACIVFGYTMNRIGMLLSNIHLRKADFNNNIAMLNIYMSTNKVDYELQSRIRSYLEYMWQVENELHQKEVQSLISKLPTTLKQDLDLQIRGNLVNSCSFLARFSKQLKKQICTIVEEVNAAPNEVLTDQTAIDKFDLFLVQAGEVEISTGSAALLNSQKILNYKEGEYFGQLQFYTGMGREAQCVSQGFTRLLKFSRINFLNLLENHSKDKEIYFYLRDCLIFSNQYHKLNLSCKCCLQETHQFTDCPYLNIVIDREKVIKKSQFPCNQYRDKSFSRKYTQKQQMHKTKVDLQLVQMAGKLMIQQMEAAWTSLSEIQIYDKSATEDTSMEDSRQLEDEKIEFANKNHLDQSVGLTVSGLKNDQTRFKFSKPSIKMEQSQILDQEEQQSQQFDYDLTHTYSQGRFRNPSIPQNPIVMQHFPSRSSILPQENKINAIQIKKLTFTNDENKPATVSPNQGPRVRPSILKNPLLKSPFIIDKDQTPEFRKSLMVARASVCKKQIKSKVQMKDKEKFSIDGFERMYQFTYYFPSGNYDLVLKKLVQNQNKTYQSVFSWYSFNLNVIKKMKKVRRFLDKRFKTNVFSRTNY